jgi:hypothetical protein
VFKTGYAAMPIIVGVGASDTTIEAAVYAGGILNKGTRTWIKGPQGGQIGPYWMNRVGIQGEANNNSYVPLVVVGGPSQSTDLSQWKDSSGNMLLKVGIAGELEGGTPAGSFLIRPSVNSNGNFSFQPRAATNSMFVQPNVANQTAAPLIVKAGTGETGNLLEVQSSAGTPIAGINVTGDLTTHSIPVPGVIGGTTPAAITGTTITANTAFAGPLNGTVGATTPAAGTFTALTVNSNGFTPTLLTDAPGAITVNTGTCTDRAVAFATMKTTGVIIPTANYALDAGISISAAQAVLNTAAHYRICNVTLGNITLNAAAAFNVMVIQ